VIVTARERWTLPGGRRWDLDLLPMDDAVALLRRLLEDGGRGDIAGDEIARGEGRGEASPESPAATVCISPGGEPGAADDLARDASPLRDLAALCGRLPLALRALVQRNLVEYDREATRYGLHVLLLACALADAAPTSLDAAYDRHAWHFLPIGATANALYIQGGEGVLAGLRLFDAARPHLLAAWQRIIG
jgi:hypothetical protein